MMPTTPINLLPLPILLMLLTYLGISHGCSNLVLNPLKSDEFDEMGTRVCDEIVESYPTI